MKKLLSVFPCMCLVAAVCVGGTAAARDGEEGKDRDRDGGKDRDAALVLGDSVPFAFIASAGFAYINPDNFHGFGNDLDHTLPLDTVNAACPGETTSSFLSSTGPDNGCRAYRANFPLHVAYNSTQLEFAKNYLKQHRDVRLITITLGANDGFLLEAGCASQANPTECIGAGVPTLLATVEHNMQTILADLRGTGFGGTIIITNYYSVDYSDAAGTGLTVLLNGAIKAPAAAFGAVVADVFTAFQAATANPAFGGKTCNAGLLNASVHNQLLCDVHPSQSGHELIAKTIAGTFRVVN
jgi:lysophospholipase L1-like esterase